MAESNKHLSEGVVSDLRTGITEALGGVTFPLKVELQAETTTLETALEGAALTALTAAWARFAKNMKLPLGLVPPNDPTVPPQLPPAIATGERPRESLGRLASLVPEFTTATAAMRDAAKALLEASKQQHTTLGKLPGEIAAAIAALPLGGGGGGGGAPNPAAAGGGKPPTAPAPAQPKPISPENEAAISAARERQRTADAAVTTQKQHVSELKAFVDALTSSAAAARTGGKAARGEFKDQLRATGVELENGKEDTRGARINAALTQAKQNLRAAAEKTVTDLKEAESAAKAARKEVDQLVAAATSVVDATQVQVHKLSKELHAAAKLIEGLNASAADPDVLRAGVERFMRAAGTKGKRSTTLDHVVQQAPQGTVAADGKVSATNEHELRVLVQQLQATLAQVKQELAGSTQAQTQTAAAVRQQTSRTADPGHSELGGKRAGAPGIANFADFNWAGLVNHLAQFSKGLSNANTALHAFTPGNLNVLSAQRTEQQANTEAPRTELVQLMRAVSRAQAKVGDERQFTEAERHAFAANPASLQAFLPSGANPKLVARVEAFAAANPNGFPVESSAATRVRELAFGVNAQFKTIGKGLAQAGQSFSAESVREQVRANRAADPSAPLTPVESLLSAREELQAITHKSAEQLETVRLIEERLQRAQVGGERARQTEAVALDKLNAKARTTRDRDYRTEKVFREQNPELLADNKRFGRNQVVLRQGSEIVVPDIKGALDFDDKGVSLDVKQAKRFKLRPEITAARLREIERANLQDRIKSLAATPGTSLSLGDITGNILGSTDFTGTRPDAASKELVRALAPEFFATHGQRQVFRKLDAEGQHERIRDILAHVGKDPVAERTRPALQSLQEASNRGVRGADEALDRLLGLIERSGQSKQALNTLFEDSTTLPTGVTLDQAPALRANIEKVLRLKAKVDRLTARIAKGKQGATRTAGLGKLADAQRDLTEAYRQLDPVLGATGDLEADAPGLTRTSAQLERATARQPTATTQRKKLLNARLRARELDSTEPQKYFEFGSGWAKPNELLQLSDDLLKTAYNEMKPLADAQATLDRAHTAVRKLRSQTERLGTTRQRSRKANAADREVERAGAEVAAALTALRDNSVVATLFEIPGQGAEAARGMLQLRQVLRKTRALGAKPEISAHRTLSRDALNQGGLTDPEQRQVQNPAYLEDATRKNLSDKGFVFYRYSEEQLERARLAVAYREQRISNGEITDPRELQQQRSLAARGQLAINAGGEHLQPSKGMKFRELPGAVPEFEPTVIPTGVGDDGRDRTHARRRKRTRTSLAERINQLEGFREVLRVAPPGLDVTERDRLRGLQQPHTGLHERDQRELEWLEARMKLRATTPAEPTLGAPKNVQLGPASPLGLSGIRRELADLDAAALKISQRERFWSRKGRTRVTDQTGTRGLEARAESLRAIEAALEPGQIDGAAIQARIDELRGRKDAPLTAAARLDRMRLFRADRDRKKFILEKAGKDFDPNTTVADLDSKLADLRIIQERARTGAARLVNVKGLRTAADVGAAGLHPGVSQNTAEMAAAQAAAERAAHNERITARMPEVFQLGRRRADGTVGAGARGTTSNAAAGADLGAVAAALTQLQGVVALLEPIARAFKGTAEVFSVFNAKMVATLTPIAEASARSGIRRDEFATIQDTKDRSRATQELEKEARDERRQRHRLEYLNASRSETLLTSNPRDLGLVAAFSGAATKTELNPRIAEVIARLQRNQLTQEAVQATIDAPYTSGAALRSKRRESRRLFDNRGGLEEQLVQLATVGVSGSDPRYAGAAAAIGRFRSAGDGLGRMVAIQDRFQRLDQLSRDNRLTPEQRAQAVTQRTELMGQLPDGITSRGALNQTVSERVQARATAGAEIATVLQTIVKEDKELDRQQRTGGLKGFSDRLRTLSQYALASGVIFGAVAGLRSAVREVIALESELVRVQGILGVTANTVRDQIGDGVINAARDFGVSVRESLDAFKIFAQAGFEPAQALERTRASLLGVQALGLQPQQSQELLLAVGNISNDQVQPGAILDRISEVERTNAVTAQDLSVAIQRVGSIATQLQPKSIGGVDAFDLVAGLTTQLVEQTRVTGNQAATSLRFIIARLGSPDVARKLQNDFGVNLGGNNPEELRPLQDILADIGSKYQELKGSGQTVKANELLATFAGARQLNAASAIFNDFAKVMEVATQSSRAFGDAQRRLVLQQDTLQYQLKVLGVEFNGFLQQFTRNSNILSGARTLVGGANKGGTSIGGLISENPLPSLAAGTTAVIGLMSGLSKLGPILAGGRLAALGTGLASLASGPVLAGIAAVLAVMTVLSTIGYASKGVDYLKAKFADPSNAGAQLLAGARQDVSEVTQFKEFTTLAGTVGLTREQLIARGLGADAAGAAALQGEFGTTDLETLRGRGKGVSGRVFDTYDKAATGALDALLSAIEPDPANRQELARSIIKQAGVQRDALLNTLLGNLQGSVDGMFAEFSKGLQDVDFTKGEGKGLFTPGSGFATSKVGEFLQGVLGRDKGSRDAYQVKGTTADRLAALVRSSIDPEFTGARASLLSSVDTFAGSRGFGPGSAAFNEQARAAVTTLRTTKGVDPTAIGDVGAFVQRREAFEASVSAQLGAYLKTGAFGTAVRGAGADTDPTVKANRALDKLFASIQRVAAGDIAALRAQGRNTEADAQEKRAKQLQSPDFRNSVAASIGQTDIGFRGLVKDRFTDIVAGFAFATKEIGDFSAAMRRAGGTFDEVSELNTLTRNSLRAALGVEGDVARNLLQVDSKLQQFDDQGKLGLTTVLSEINLDETTPEKRSLAVQEGLRLLESPERATQRTALDNQGAQLIAQLGILRNDKNIGLLSDRSREQVDAIFTQPDSAARNIMTALNFKEVITILEEFYAATERILVGRAARQAAIRELGDMAAATTRFATDVAGAQRTAKLRLTEGLFGTNAARGLRLDDAGLAAGERQAALAADFDVKRQQLEASLKDRGAEASPAGDVERQNLNLEAAKAQVASTRAAQLQLKQLLEDDSNLQTLERDRRGASVLQPIASTLADVLARPGAFSTGTARGESAKAVVDSIATSFQQAMSRAFVDNLFGANGVFGHKVRGALGDVDLFKGSEVVRDNLSQGAQQLGATLDRSFAAGAAALQQALSALTLLGQSAELSANPGALRAAVEAAGPKLEFGSGSAEGFSIAAPLIGLGGMYGVGAGVPGNVLPPLEVRRKVVKDREALQRAAASLGISPALLEAQLDLESDGGTRPGGRFNYGNIKAGKSWKGPTRMGTDNANGSRDPYREYASEQAFLTDYTDTLRLKFPKVYGAGEDVDAFNTGLLHGKYGSYHEDKDYAAKLRGRLRYAKPPTPTRPRELVRARPELASFAVQPAFTTFELPNRSVFLGTPQAQPTPTAFAGVSAPTGGLVVPELPPFPGAPVFTTNTKPRKPEAPPAVPPAPAAMKKPEGATKKEQLKDMGQQISALVGTQLGAAFGARGKQPGNFASQGASIGAGLGAFIPVPILGPLIGGLVGGMLGGLIGGKKPEAQLDPLQRIERNTRETVTAIENQSSKLLEIQDRFINVPSGFSVPRYRPQDVGRGGTSVVQPQVGSIVVNVNGADNPAAVADAVYRRLSHEMQVQINSVGYRD